MTTDADSNLQRDWGTQGAIQSQAQLRGPHLAQGCAECKKEMCVCVCVCVCVFERERETVAVSGEDKGRNIRRMLLNIGEVGALKLL